PQDLNRADTYEDNSITDKKERAKIIGQYDHVRIYGRDYFTKLRNIGFKVEEVDYAKILSDAEVDDYRLVKADAIPSVSKSALKDILLKSVRHIFHNVPLRTQINNIAFQLLMLGQYGLCFLQIHGHKGSGKSICRGTIVRHYTCGQDIGTLGKSGFGIYGMDILGACFGINFKFPIIP